MPAMFIPPLWQPDLPESLQMYPGEPKVTDGSPAIREEKTTIVLNEAGQYRLPGLSISWWNTDAARIETSTLAAVSFSVGGVTSASQRENLTANRIPPAGYLGLLLAVGLLIAAALRYRWKSHEAAPDAEGDAFRLLLKAAGSGNRPAAYHATLQWIDAAGWSSSTQAFESDALLGTSFARLGKSVWGGDVRDIDLEDIDMEDFARRLRQLRASRHKASSPVDDALPMLNP